MKIGHIMTTLSEAMDKFRNSGFDNDFEMNDNKLISTQTKKSYEPEELTIKQTLRFEGESDPADMSILYAIEADDGTKGLLIDAFGTYAAQDGKSLDEIIKNMKIDEIHSKD